MAGSGGGLRIAVLIVEPVAFRLVAAWAGRHGHRLVLLVTTPGPPHTWHNRDYHDLVGIVPATQDVLVSTRMRRVVAPVLRALAPDLVLSFTFPHRIPPEVVELPRLGAVNLHPTPLPVGRGPNPRRLLYEGRTTLGATLHRIAPAFDAGPVLSRRERPVPAGATPEAVRAAWMAVLDEALEEGVGRVLAGERGVPQDEAGASYAASFTDEERKLDWRLPVAELRRRALALTLFHPEAWAEIGGRGYAVRALVAVEPPAVLAAPGTLLGREGDRFRVAVADGVVEVAAVPLAENDLPREGGGEGW